MEDMLKAIANEQFAIYQRALLLQKLFVAEAKAYRKNNNYMFYEPNVKNVNDVTYIYWQDVKFYFDRRTSSNDSNSYKIHKRHMSMGKGANRYASNKFRSKAPELHLVLAFEKEFSKLRSYGKELSLLRKQATKSKSLKDAINWQEDVDLKDLLDD